MRKYSLDSRWKPTRGQILASYRLSAEKHPAEQLGENHLNTEATFGLYSLEYRQQFYRLIESLKKLSLRK